jgi:hypothetical protein
LTIEGHADRDGAGGPWHIRIALVGEAGEVLGLRELGAEAGDCRALDDEIALVIAVLVDPGAALVALPPPAPPALPPPAPPALPPAPAAPPPSCPPVSPPPAPWRVGAQVGAAGALGVLPTVAPGLAFRGRIAPPHWPSFEVGGAFWRSQEVGPVGAGFSLAWGSLAVCPLEPEKDGNRLLLCVGALAGALRAESRGLTSPLVLEQLVLDASAGVRYERRLVGPLVASAGFDLLVPTVRDAFFYLTAAGERRDVFRMTPVAGTGALMLGVDFR